MRFYAVILTGKEWLIIRFFVVFIATIFIWGCSRHPCQLKEEVQLSSQRLRILKQTSEGVLEIDLYQAIAIAIKNNRDLRLNLMDSVSQAK